MRDNFVVAIDGPSGSGKSSVSRAVASTLGYAYLDTGAMYRALTWWSMQGHNDLSTCPLVISTDPQAPGVMVDGRDVGADIRGPEVTAQVSRIAADPTVRALAVAMQRDIIERAQPGIVVEGRDITSVVAPDAEVRIFLTADLAAREQRRAAEFSDPDLAERMRGTVASRDAVDASRAHSPLTIVDGVTTIDATHRNLEQVIALVLDLVAEATGGPHVPR